MPVPDPAKELNPTGIKPGPNGLKDPSQDFKSSTKLERFGPLQDVVQLNDGKYVAIFCLGAVALSGTFLAPFIFGFGAVAIIYQLSFVLKG